MTSIVRRITNHRSLTAHFGGWSSWRGRLAPSFRPNSGIKGLLPVVLGLLVLFHGAFVSAQDLSAARPRLDLSGIWEFQMDPEDKGLRERWFEYRSPFASQAPVPGTWNTLPNVGFPSEKELRDYEQQFLNGHNLPGTERESEKLFHVFPGPAWYSKEISIPAEWAGKVPWLHFKGIHRQADIWIDGKPVASHRSYITPLRIDLSPFAKLQRPIRVVVRVDSRRNDKVDPLMGCLDTLDFLYVSWGGIHRPVELECTTANYIDNVYVVPRLKEKLAELQVRVSGPVNDHLSIGAQFRNGQGKLITTIEPAHLPVGTHELTLSGSLPEPELWEPRSPHLYSVTLTLHEKVAIIDAKSTRFGMREFTVQGTNFLLNGKPIFLRGYGDDCIFPNSICPPNDKTELRQRLATARNYGFNYVRHHSWIPPEEYLDAADELGMMLQPEFPFAYGWDLPKTPEAQQAAIDAWKETISANRNHPSIVTWCMGNEHYDSFRLAEEMYAIAKRLDPSRPVIDSDGCGFRHQARRTLDFLVVQFNEGSSIGFLDGKYTLPPDLTKPVIGHEMGYFVTLPELDQVNMFRDGLRPYWLYQTKSLAERRGILGYYSEWLNASYRLQAASLKCNLEAARSAGLMGTSVWLFQDYPNCAEGVVDMFFRPKALRPETFRQFNGSTVLLLDAPRRNWWSGELARVKLRASRFEDAPSDNAVVRWELCRANEVLRSGRSERTRVNAEGLTDLIQLDLTMPVAEAAEELELRIQLSDENGTIHNSWKLWVFPRPETATAASRVRFDGIHLPTLQDHGAAEPPKSRTPLDVLVTTNFTTTTVEYLREGGNVILLAPESAFPTESTHYRLSSWDGGGPSGTIFDRHHPALRCVPSEGWCDLQYYNLIEGAKTTMLDGITNGIVPLVRCIDRPTRFANRAYLFEASVAQGKLLVSGFNFQRALALNDPAAESLLFGLIHYAQSKEFEPKAQIPLESLGSK